MAEFLQNTLKLELSQEKTLITNARAKPARFLGYHIINQNADTKQHKIRHQRCINGAMGLKVPLDVIQAKCSKYMCKGKSIHRTALVNDTDYSIVAQYQAEYRGITNYYLMAFNVHRLWKLHRVMSLSLAKTLAKKHKVSVRKVFRKYKKTVETPHGTLKVLEVTHQRREGKKPLVARFGGIELRWQKQATLYDEPKEVYNGRSEIVQRLLAQECELCGSVDKCEVHHIRKLADLNKPGQRERPLWVKRMAARQRKTLVVCQKCHREIHYKNPLNRKLSA